MVASSCCFDDMEDCWAVLGAAVMATVFCMPSCTVSCYLGHQTMCIGTLCKVCISLAVPLSCSPVGNGVGVPLHTTPHSGINYIILGSAVGGSALFLLCLTLLCVICVCLCCCCRGRRSKRARRKMKKQQQVARGFPNRVCDDGNIHVTPVSQSADAGYPVLQPTHSMSSVAYPQLQPAYSLGTFSTLGEPPAYSGLVSLVEGEEET